MKIGDVVRIAGGEGTWVIVARSFSPDAGLTYSLENCGTPSQRNRLAGVPAEHLTLVDNERSVNAATVAPERQRTGALPPGTQVVVAGHSGYWYVDSAQGLKYHLALVEGGDVALIVDESLVRVSYALQHETSAGVARVTAPAAKPFSSGVIVKAGPERHLPHIAARLQELRAEVGEAVYREHVRVLDPRPPMTPIDASLRTAVSQSPEKSPGKFWVNDDPGASRRMFVFVVGHHDLVNLREIPRVEMGEQQDLDSPEARAIVRMLDELTRRRT